MSFLSGERLRAAFAPPRYLDLPLAGVDLSTSGVKAVRLSEDAEGLTLASYAEAHLPPGAFVNGEIVDRNAVAEALSEAARAVGARSVNAALPESKSFLFETEVTGSSAAQWRVEIEQCLDELVPLPPAETDFDFIGVGRTKDGNALVAGVGFAGRIIDDELAVFDQAGVSVRALEGETFAAARALLHPGDASVVLIIDVGKTTTKLTIVMARIPRFSTTIAIGGHALTLAVQKYFGVTESEARRVKADRGIVPAAGNEDYLAAMLSTVAAIRDEIMLRLNYWQEKAGETGHPPVSRALLVGGNASVRGLPEYLEGALNIPVEVGDVFANLSSRDTWVPELDFTESLAYAAAIGLALHGHFPYA